MQPLPKPANDTGRKADPENRRDRDRLDRLVRLMTEELAERARLSDAGRGPGSGPPIVDRAGDHGSDDET